MCRFLYTNLDQVITLSIGEIWEFEYISHHNLPVQLTPFPVYPEMQKQLNEPGVLVQFAFVSQLSVAEAHSLISVEQVVTNIQLGHSKHIALNVTLQNRLSVFYLFS